MERKEDELAALTECLTVILQDYVALGGNDISYEIGEEDGYSPSKPTRKLSLSQIVDVLTCLRSRDLLPASIRDEECRTITGYSTFCWFETLRDERLAQLAMGTFVDWILDGLVFARRGHAAVGTANGKGDCYMPLEIYSCHDSSLIGLICAFRLQQPSVWSEYGSYLKVELFADTDEAAADHGRLLFT